MHLTRSQPKVVQAVDLLLTGSGAAAARKRKSPVPPELLGSSCAQREDLAQGVGSKECTRGHTPVTCHFLTQTRCSVKRVVALVHRLAGVVTPGGTRNHINGCQGPGNLITTLAFPSQHLNHAHSYSRAAQGMERQPP